MAEAGVVLCDFDGTVSPQNVMDFLYRRFAGCGMTYAERWERGEISTRQEMRMTFATVRAGRQEMEQALSSIALDPGLAGLIATCRRRGWPLGIVSDGLEWYIHYLLQRAGVAGVPVYANRIHFEGGGFRLEFPWYDAETPLRGVCKRKIVRRFRESGFRVAFAGDGMSDFDAVGEADLVFARDGLMAHCRASGIPATGFQDLSDLVRHLEGAW